MYKTSKKKVLERCIESCSSRETEDFVRGGGGGKNYMGALGKNKKEPLKIAIDCNVKACSMLQI